MTKKKPTTTLKKPEAPTETPAAALTDNTSGAMINPPAAIAKEIKDKEAPFADVPEGWTESAVWTGSGYLDVLDPVPEAIDLNEIARGLARQYRFGPAIVDNYTAAEHSVGCYRIMRAIAIAEGWPEEKRTALERAALLHDAPEYIIGDLLSPIKRQCPDFQKIDDALSRVIEVRFDLPEGILDDPEVHRVDRLACDTEARVFLPFMPAWPGMSDGHPDGICRTTKPAAYFLRTAHSLGLI